MMLFPNFATLSAIRAIKEVLAIIKTTGSAVDARSHCVALDEMMELAGMGAMEKLAERYATPEPTTAPVGKS